MVRQLPVIRTMVMEIRGTSRAFLKPCRLTNLGFPNFRPGAPRAQHEAGHGESWAGGAPQRRPGAGNPRS